MKKYVVLWLMILALALTALSACQKAEEEEVGVTEGVVSGNETEEKEEATSKDDKDPQPEQKPTDDQQKEEQPTDHEQPEQKPADDQQKEEQPTDDEQPEQEPEQKPQTPDNDPPAEDGPKDANGFALPEEGIDYTNGYIKVMSYNIKHLGAQSAHMEELVEYIKTANPDIVCFQEVDNGHSRSGKINQVEEIARKCGYQYYHFGKNIDIESGGTYGNAMISKFPIKKSEVVNFNAVSPDDHNRSYCRYELTVDGKTLCVYNMHGTLDGTDDKRYIGREVTQMFKAAEKDRYAVLMGDFNLQAQYMPEYMDADKFMVLNGGLDFDTFIYTFNSSEPTSNIDNIMVSRSLEYYWNHQTGVGCETDKNPTISDHNPIYTWIRIPE